MDFNIVGKIAHVETIAEGNGIREIANLKARYGSAIGAKRKASPIFAYLTAVWSLRKSTGMKRMASARSK